MAEICSQIPETLEGYDLNVTGYHRGCYVKFASHLDRLKHGSDTEPGPAFQHSPRKSATGIVFGPECIFCDKDGPIHVTIGNNRTTQRTTKFTLPEAWVKIERIAEKRGDTSLLRKIKGVDLFAAEAKYHNYCRRQFTKSPTRGRSQNLETIMEHADQTTAHNEAFETVVEFVEDHVITKKKVIQLSSLRRMYVAKLEETGFANAQYRSEKLMRRLANHEHLGSKLTFIKVEPDEKGFVSFYLVYSSSLTVSEAVSHVYKLANKDSTKDTAMLLRGIIRRAFNDSKNLTWPPTAADLIVGKEMLPEELQRFLNLVIAGNNVTKSEKTERLVLSIGQDLCRSVTNAEWKLPKHILLCMTVRHMYRSRQLTTLLNRLGNCESYDFGIELEMALSKALEESSTLLTPQIVSGAENELFHSEWDNYNQVLTGVHGKSCVNASAGIMIQEKKDDIEPSQSRTLPTATRSRERSSKPDPPASLPPLHIYKRKGPVMENCKFDPPPGNEQCWKLGLQVYQLWLLCRKVCSSGKQTVAALGGFISATGKPPKRKSTIDYYTSINEPITEYNTIKELLHRCSAATAEVGQEYTITTFDLGVCMKALPLIWSNPDDNSSHIILIGAFHIILSYLKMIAHKMAGSGYSEILLEAALITSGCLKGVLSGKAYAKALYCLKVVSEAMERFLLQQFIEETGADITDISALLALLQSCDQAHLQECQVNEAVMTFVEKYTNYQEKVREGHLGKTGAFWFEFIDHARIVFMILYAVKTNELRLFHSCVAKMAVLFYAYGGQNYARYLTWFDGFLTNVETTHPGSSALLEKGAISVARSLIPSNLCAVDKTMEETYMKFAKSHGGVGGAGLSGILENYGAYQRWNRTMSTRVQFYQSTLEMCGMVEDPDSSKTGKHRECQPTEIKRMEDAVQRASTAIVSFSNPFTIADKDKLFSISSGAAASPKVEASVLSAEKAGKEAKDEFIRERLQSDEKDFFDRIPKMKLLTMETSNKKVKLSSTQGKLVQYQEQGDLAFQLLIKSQLMEQPISLSELMKFCLTPVPHSLGTPDGFLAKTDKAKIVHYILSDTLGNADLPVDKTLYIDDGNAVIHMMKDLPPTFGDICLKLLDMTCHKVNVVFSTDSYHPHSIKAQERLRRGISDKLLLAGTRTRKPPEFKTFLLNDENKSQLFAMMLKVWSSNETAKKLEGRSVVLIVEGAAHLLTSDAGETHVSEIHPLRSNQEETDTRVILYLQYAVTEGYQSAIIRSPDSDIFFILLHYADQSEITVYMDTGTGKHRKLINITDTAHDLGAQYTSALMGLYCFTGEDCNCAFKGKGKVGPLKKLEKNPRFQKVFAELGSSWDVEPSLVTDLEEFTCIMYGHPRITDIDEVRVPMLKKMTGENETFNAKAKVDLTRLPPCKKSLYPHIRRVNYRVAQWKRSHIPIFEIPPATSHGWVEGDDGHLEPLWSDGPVLPPSLVDILVGRDEDDDGQDADDDDVNEFADLVTYIEDEADSDANDE